MNLPNKLTVLRIILIPVFLVLILNFKLYTAAGIVFVVASLTDFADGKIARSKGLVTNFGKFADPLADKLLVSAALISLCVCNKLGTSLVFGAWAAFIIIAREFIVTGIRLVAAADGKVIAAGMSGKIKTTVQMITIVYILFSDLFVQIGLSAVISGIISNIFVISSVIMTVYSGAEYLIENKSIININS